MNNKILLILLMGIVTFCCRYSFIAIPNNKKQLDKKWSTMLSYMPPAFLTTMIVPSIVFTDSTYTIHILNNPYFYATVITLLLTKFTKNFTVITLAGTIVFFIIKFIFGCLGIQ